MTNLNQYKLPNDGIWPDTCFGDNSVISSGDTSVYFRDLEKHLIGHIKESKAVFGAVAWLTSEPILEAMAGLEQVQIVVQKEDFLRPDTGITSAKEWKKKLRRMYNKLKCTIRRGEFENWVLGATSLGSDYPMDPVRCAGRFDNSNNPSKPRMHNKFLVFVEVTIGSDAGYPVYLFEPRAVWTGSFNFTKNAANSLENAVYITDRKIVNAYFAEYTQIAAMSEKLDWKSNWIAPEWHIGA